MVAVMCAHKLVCVCAEMERGGQMDPAVDLVA